MSSNEPPTGPAADSPTLRPMRVKVARLDRQRHSSLQALHAITLREGPRSRREARYTVIRSPRSGTVKHDSLTIKSFKKRQGEWGEDLEHSVTLTSEGEVDEIRSLLDFLWIEREGAGLNQEGDYVVLAAPADQAQALQRALEALSPSARVDILADLLEGVAGDPKLLQALAKRAHKDPELFAEAATALNLATYHRAVQRLNNLIDAPAVGEAQFQAHLQANPWMFGSEYSRVLERRRWTRDEQQDFIARRTTDGFIELIEIKTPLNGSPLFLRDKSHQSYYPCSELAKALGQVQKYIERLDADRDKILVLDGEDTAKIRAKLVIGRTIDDEQEHALRCLNGHLHRIEIITFDQLLRIAQRVTQYLRHALRGPSHE